MDDVAESPRVLRDYEMEGHLKAIARWYTVTGVIFQLAALFGAGSLIVRARRLPGQVDPDFVALATYFAISAIALVIGHSLSRFSNVARRVVHVLVGIIFLLCFLGLLFNGLMLAQGAGNGPQQIPGLVNALFSTVWWGSVTWTVGSDRSEEICTDHYRRDALAHPGPRGYASPYCWVPLILLALSFIVVATRALA